MLTSLVYRHKETLSNATKRGHLSSCPVQGQGSASCDEMPFVPELSRCHIRCAAAGVAALQSWARSLLSVSYPCKFPLIFAAPAAVFMCASGVFVHRLVIRTWQGARFSGCRGIDGRMQTLQGEPVQTSEFIVASLVERLRCLRSRPEGAMRRMGAGIAAFALRSVLWQGTEFGTTAAYSPGVYVAAHRVTWLQEECGMHLSQAHAISHGTIRYPNKFVRYGDERARAQCEVRIRRCDEALVCLKRVACERRSIRVRMPVSMARVGWISQQPRISSKRPFQCLLRGSDLWAVTFRH